MKAKEANKCMIPVYGIYYFYKRSKTIEEYKKDLWLQPIGVGILALWNWILLLGLWVLFR